MPRCPIPPGQVKPGETVKFEAYLFAHMLQGDYGRLYYSVSRDGLHWEMLNRGRRVYEDYRGHASLVKGHGGRYYLVGNRGDDQPDIYFWVSDDLITLNCYSCYSPDLKRSRTIPAPCLGLAPPNSFLTWPEVRTR